MFFYPDSLSFSVQKYNFLRSSGTSRNSRRSSRISRQDSSIIIAVYYVEIFNIACMVNMHVYCLMHILHVDLDVL